MPLRIALGLFCAGGIAALAQPCAALAEVWVAGDVNAVKVETRDATIAEVLTALGKALDVSIRVSSPLDEAIAGTYEGSLRQVMSRVLDGRNYVAKYAPGDIEIRIVAPAAQSPRRVLAAPAQPKLPEPRTSMTRPRYLLAPAGRAGP